MEHLHCGRPGRWGALPGIRQPPGIYIIFSMYIMHDDNELEKKYSLNKHFCPECSSDTYLLYKCIYFSLTIQFLYESHV